MDVNEQLIRHLARLAALDVTDEEVSRLKSELGDIVAYFEKLSELDTEGVEPLAHVHDLVNAFREDIPRASMNIELVRKNSPDFALGGFRVPKIISSS